MTVDPRDKELPWYERAFDAVYREVYPHRSDEQALLEVDFVEEFLKPPTTIPLLDLCCGHGRHAAAWAKKSRPVVGLDLSADLVTAARARKLSNSLFVRGDMRELPFRSDAFGLVGSFFTSFGYFDQESEDERVLAEIARVLAHEGRFILDFLNADRVRATLVPESRTVRRGYDIKERRRIDEQRGRVLKDVIIQAPDGREHLYHESVRLYSAGDLDRLCSRAGLAIEGLLGDLRGSAHHSMSERTVIHGGRRS